MIRSIARANLALLFAASLVTATNNLAAQSAPAPALDKSEGAMQVADVIMIYALNAMQAAGRLTDLNVTIVMTGDEEYPGEPLSVARHLKGTTAEISFSDGYPPMAVTGRYIACRRRERNTCVASRRCSSGCGGR